MKKNDSYQIPISKISRRTAVRLTALSLIGGGSGVLTSHVANGAGYQSDPGREKGKPDSDD